MYVAWSRSRNSFVLADIDIVPIYIADTAGVGSRYLKPAKGSAAQQRNTPHHASTMMKNTNNIDDLLS